MFHDAESISKSPGDVQPVRMGRLIGVSSAMQAVFDRIEKAAQCDMPVLVYGPAGSGKQTVVRTIHEASRRSFSPFVPVRCRDHPETLMARLFGNPDANNPAERQGRLAAARGGTLYLEGMAELAPEVQVALLRHLEREEDGGARITAGTRRDPMELLTTGQLREDFHYRIHVIPIRVPDLSERREDIALLAEVLAEEAGIRPERLHGSAWAAGLAHRAWPGNVRELSLFIREQYGWMGDEAAPVCVDTFLGDRSLKEAVARFERAVILRTLMETGWHKTMAARRMGVDRKTLFNKMRAHGIGQDSNGGKT